MTSFLFWNLNRRPLQQMVTNLAHLHQVDILTLAECTIPPDDMLAALNRGTTALYHYAPSYACERIDIFTRFPEQFLSPKYDDDTLTIRHLKLPGLSDILMAATHYPSKLHWRDSSQSHWCTEIAHAVRLIEEEVGHTRTLLLGDLNMNPFENGLLSATGLHSVLSPRIAQRGARVIRSREYLFFYNPMWSLYGNVLFGPAGTYYYSSAEPVTLFWNMFDQVLIRPDLISCFIHEDLQILTSVGETSLLTSSGIPDTATASDHLPLLFRIDL